MLSLWQRVTFDSNLSFGHHTANIIQSCFCHLKNIPKIRDMLNFNDAEEVLLFHAFISSCLDYINSVCLFRLPLSLTVAVYPELNRLIMNENLTKGGPVISLQFYLQFSLSVTHMYTHNDMKQSKAANPHFWEAGISFNTCFLFLLEKWLSWLINYKNCFQ